MANQFLSVQEIARQCLPILKDNLVFPALCHRDYEQSFSKRGDTITVKKPPMYEAKNFTGTISCQDVNEESVQVRLDKIADVSVALTSKEMALNLESFTDQVLKPAVAAIAEKINADGMQLFDDVSNEIGKRGQAPDSMKVFAQAGKQLNQAKAPVQDRYAIWSPEAISHLQLIDGVVGAEKSGSTKALRDGSIGRILGIENYMSQAVPSHVSGDVRSFKLASAAQAGAHEISVIADSGTAFKSGDAAELDGVEYEIQNDAAVSGTAEVTLTLTEGLKKQLAKDTKGTICAEYSGNMVFQRNAFAFVTRPLEPARGAESYLVEYEGLPLRVTIGYDMTTKMQIMSVDMLYGFVTLYPQLACRVMS